ncbi:MAG: HDOD domain-containing protein [Zoogloeaceae bacterium]|uniref:HDOD domain-containing protein n=1 Tax=Denitromonas sp. TaxID=2734609 RepID=UPI001D65E77E|nr:HDOD domain-containing protein [Rhodocyclaceae bacterium]MCP5221695.1 HDOD domain-containing protein [Zoogloeaceae bacterium]MCZ4304933.1 HDOD domain-containing protein [Zoogloeaceae bacterium G21618-S1]HQU88804.1 HDOD domain-containing protein [Denitromonas sp.]
MTRLNEALPSLDAYVDLFSQGTLPVLRRTARDLAAMREQEGSVNGKQIAQIILGDPLMTLRVLSHLEIHRRQAQNHAITTIDRAVMMIGITPFFRHFEDLPTIEDALADTPAALIGVLGVIGRARRASHYAREWAIIRHDLDVEEITIAALLHDTADILLWAFAPALTTKAHAMQRADASLRSATVQREVFGFAANEIQLALAKKWQLPDLIIHLMDESSADNPRVRTVALANALARHNAKGWDNAAIPDDLTAIQSLLKLNQEQLIRRLAIPEEHAIRLMPAPEAEPASRPPAAPD